MKKLTIFDVLIIIISNILTALLIVSVGGHSFVMSIVGVIAIIMISIRVMAINHLSYLSRRNDRYIRQSDNLVKEFFGDENIDEDKLKQIMNMIEENTN